MWKGEWMYVFQGEFICLGIISQMAPYRTSTNLFDWDLPLDQAVHLSRPRSVPGVDSASCSVCSCRIVPARPFVPSPAVVVGSAAAPWSSTDSCHCGSVRIVTVWRWRRTTEGTGAGVARALTSAWAGRTGNPTVWRTLGPGRGLVSVTHPG